MEEDDSGQDWLARYADSFKVAKASLKLIWADLKVSETGQKGRLDRVHSQALERWPAAVKEAEQERANVQAQILQAREECQKLAYELGADSTEDLEREVVSGEEPLIDQFHRVSRTLQTWRERRAERLERYQGLQPQLRSVVQEVCNALRKQMGRPKTPDKQKPDLTENGLQQYSAVLSLPAVLNLLNVQALSVAGDRLQTEVKKQMRELDDVLLELSKTCLMLGEDEVAAAADVHASLRHYKPLSLQQQNVRSSQAHTVPDLSAETFDGLHRKIAALERSKVAWGYHEEAGLSMRFMQVDRETEADSLHEVLLNLWDLLGIGEDDINRQLTTFAMQGPARLQTPMIAQAGPPGTEAFWLEIHAAAPSLCQQNFKLRGILTLYMSFVVRLSE
ncbi:hypothetical protein MMC29_000848 [Sticta canariensis]|nr:hypothetical protein [Sticta canariensis]